MAGVQFTGMASGLDTNSIVQAMLSTQQSRIDNATNDKARLEWKQEQWKNVNSLINKFYSDFVDKMRYQSTFESYTAKTSSEAIGVKTAGDMPVGTHKVQVTKLATEVSEVGDIKTDIESKTQSFKKLGLLKDGEVTELYINQEKDASGTVIPGKEGTKIEITADDTLATLEKKIKAADDKLNVNFDLKNKKLFISSKETGTEAKINIDISNGKADFLDNIGLSNSINKVGEQAEYTYNGQTFKSDTNEVEINGLSFTLKEITTSPVIIEVKNDVDKVVDFVSGFVEAYNELTDKLNKLYSAGKVSLKPLTDEQKQGMTDKQIDEYEQSIKESLLRRDPNLKQAIDTLRGSLQGMVKGNKYGSLSAVGITTGSYSENGKLTLNKDKLKKALEEDPEAVKELFTGKGETVETIVDGKKVATLVAGTNGIGQRLYAGIQELSKRIDGVKSYQSYYNDKLHQDKIKSSNEKINELKEKYTKMEKIYYKKFVAMEKAMSMMNSQSSSLLGMMGN